MLLSRMSLRSKIAEMYVVASNQPVGYIGYQGSYPPSRLCAFRLSASRMAPWVSSQPPT